jgi:hypothetical protein
LREDFPRAQTATSDEGQLYWAWAPTGSEYWFGYAGAAGDVIRWQYAGADAPSQGPGGDVDWRHPLHDPAHPDW